MSCERQSKNAPVTSKPKEFSLIKPKPPSLPMPELIPQLEKCKPVPDTGTNEPPKEKQKIEEIKKKNEQRNEIRRPIKLNVAAILRQKALYCQKVVGGRQRVQWLVEGGGDHSAFLQWQKEMCEWDLQEEEAKTERRRMDAQLACKKAVMAHARVMEQHQKASRLRKHERDELMLKNSKQRLQEEKQMRDLVQQVAEHEKNVKMVRERLQKLKQNEVKEFTKKNQELKRQALDKSYAEILRKFKLYQEKRAAESLPHVRFRNFDDTETAGHGLLEEMSLAELKERLARVKATRGKELQEKRESIVMENQLKKQLLLEETETINLHRTAIARAGAVRKEKEMKEKLELEQKVRLQTKLEEDKREYQKLMQGQRKVKTSEMTTVQFRTNAERRHQDPKKEINWKQIEQNLEQHIQFRQKLRGL